MRGNTVSFFDFDALFSNIKSIEDFPSADALIGKNIPFATQLAELAHNEKYKDHNNHIKDVVVKANFMINNNPSALIPDLDEKNSIKEQIDKLFFELQVWANHYQLDSKRLIRTAAVYHDIGKWIVKERHPTEGYYLLQYLFPEEEKKFQLMVGSEAFQLLLSVIRDHDKFGIISTGEASLNVMVDLLNPAKSEIQFYNMALVTLMLTNFADIAVSAPNGFSGLQAKWIIEDVNNILYAIEQGEGNRLEVSYNLLKMDSNASRVTCRIARLVDACYKNAKRVQKMLENKGKEKYNESDWENISIDRITDVVDRKLQVHFLGSSYQRFCVEFAHYSKFDYALYFFGEVARQLNLKRIGEKKDQFPLEDLVGLVVQVIKSIVETYRELIHESEASPRRIGVQMQSLLREGIKETVTGFLAGTKGPASRDVANVVSWITNEVSAWLFI